MKSFIVDSFTDTAFKGNPAGVCFVERPLSDERMLDIAAELNLSETAFLQSTQQPGSFAIRYFSPKKEIPRRRPWTWPSGWGRLRSCRPTSPGRATFCSTFVRWRSRICRNET